MSDSALPAEPDVGQRLVDRLVAYGVRRVFGVPGGQTAPFYHGLAVSRETIEHVLMRDERSAVFAADAYARVSGAVGVCDATVGPGATNLVSGLVEAYSSSIPVLAVVADIPRSWEHRRHLGSASQGFEQRDILAPCVKWYGRVEVPDQMEDILDHCMRVATSNRPGPVVIEVPDDVFSGIPRAAAFSDGLSGAVAYPRCRTAPDPDAVERAASVLDASRRPLLLAGGGTHLSGAYDAVQNFAEDLQIPVATTISGKGTISEQHPLAVGTCGSFGIPAVNELLRHADCVVMVGCKAGQAATLGWQLPRPDAHIIHIDVDAEEIGRSFAASIPVQADARLGVLALRDAVATGLGNGWDLAAVRAETARWWDGETAYTLPEDERIKPQDVVRQLAHYMSDDDLLVCDASLASGWAGSHWRVGVRGRRIIAPRGLAGLGWGLPAATGAALAMRDAGRKGRVVCLAGDGGWGYSLSEIETLARMEAPVASVVLNNATLAWNKHVAMRRYPDAWVSQDFLEVDYAAAARALGAHAVRITDPEGLAAGLRGVFAVHGRPSVMEVLSSQHETPVLKSMSGNAASVEGGY